jgi:hypothetical protein
MIVRDLRGFGTLFLGRRNELFFLSRRQFRGQRDPSLALGTILPYSITRMLAQSYSNLWPQSRQTT